CVELAGKIALELRPLGFTPDREIFKPHLTMARIREDRRDHWETLREDMNQLPWPVFSVERFFLFKSTLKPTGAEYDKLGEFPLQECP
ncbi:MAG: 2'-5' RNA ligase family protein, partial [Desulfovibrionales bacterium]